MLIGENFNARTGKVGFFWSEGVEKEETKKSEDTVKDTEGINLLEMVEENGWKISDESMEGNNIRDYNFIGEKNSWVTDYVIIQPMTKHRIRIRLLNNGGAKI